MGEQSASGYRRARAEAAGRRQAGVDHGWGAGTGLLAWRGLAVYLRRQAAGSHCIARLPHEGAAAFPAELDAYAFTCDPEAPVVVRRILPIIMAGCASLRGCMSS